MLLEIQHVRRIFKKSKMLPCGSLSLNPFIEISIRNNSSSSDVLNIQASKSISPKSESPTTTTTTSHCQLLMQHSIY